MNIIIAILLMGNVETQLELKKNDEYKLIKTTIRVVRLIHGIK